MNLGLSFDDVLLRPQYSEVKSRGEPSTYTRLSNHIVLDIPIIASNMDTVTEFDMAKAMENVGGMGIVHRFMTIENQADIVGILKFEECDNVCAAVGIKDEDKRRIDKLVSVGVDAVCVDVASGDNLHCHNMIRWIRKNHPNLDIIAGNVCTYDSVGRMVDAGANSIKVGVGGGSICVTRIVTGFGIPQLTAIIECKRYLIDHSHSPNQCTLIADGGIKNSGDIVKALAAGANAVMIGNLFSGTTESPGEIVYKDGKPYKEYRGMASKSANETRRNLDVNIANSFNSTPEGVEALVPYKGSVIDIVKNLVGGLRSGMSYAGALTIDELQENAEFIQITNSGLRESNYHDVTLMKNID